MDNVKLNEKFFNLGNQLYNVIKLKSPPPTSWSPSIIDTYSAYLQENPIKLSIFSPLYICFISIGMLTAGAIIGIDEIF
jgi:hypothetical protein